MRIDFDDEEYPELARYLENPKRKMKFLYFLEELFTENSFDPVVDGLALLEERRNLGKPQQQVQSQPQDQTAPYLESFANALAELTKKLDGAAIGRFPTEHVIHEVEKPEKKKTDEDEIDYSSTEGIDFGPAIAMFEE